MIDQDGYRLNVGIIIVNADKNVLVAKRYGFHDAWQFPQGGMKDNETPEQAMYRELDEELGLAPESVDILQESQQWLAYHLPERFIRYDDLPVVIGQKQKWFLLRLRSDESAINLETSDRPEFDDWRWVDYWLPVKLVIEFKRDVYQQALQEFAEYLHIEK